MSKTSDSRLTRFISDVSTVLLALSALTVAAVAVIRVASDGRSETARPATGRLVREWRQLAAAGTPLDATDASDTIVVISDYQCPYCRLADSVVSAVRAELDSPFAVRVLHLPIEAIHPHAWNAAVAAECAASQGAFARFHSVLFEAQDSIGRISNENFARRANVPELQKFEACRAASAAAARVARHSELINDLGVSGTPAFIIDGRLLIGPTVVHLSTELRKKRH